MTTTEDDTMCLPFTVSRNPCCSCANAMVVADREEMDGAGRALPQRGFSALQPCRTSMASNNVLSNRREA
jgi:hypothetical protein